MKFASAKFASACRPTPAARVVLAVLTCFAIGARAGDPEAGEQAAQTCAGCHGLNGLSESQPTYPIIAGQYEDYLVHALEAYRSGRRENAIMNGIAGGLSDQDIDNLAAYYALQPSALDTAPRTAP